MKRLFIGLFVPAFLLMAAPALAGSTSTSHPASSSSSSTTTSSKKHSCPAGEHYVKGYTTKDGKQVKGYCRKS